MEKEEQAMALSTILPVEVVHFNPLNFSGRLNATSKPIEIPAFVIQFDVSLVEVVLIMVFSFSIT